MKTLLIIAVIVLLIVALVAYFYTMRKKQHKSLEQQTKEQQPLSSFQLMMKAMEIMAQDETEDGKVPGGYSKFGHDATNPIPTKGIMGETAYLAMLKTENEVKVEYKRKGHTRTENIKHPVDMYEIRENGEYVCMLYLCPYYKENSAIAPTGFKLLT